MPRFIPRPVRLLTVALATAACSGGKEAPQIPLGQARADSAHAAAGVQVAPGAAAGTVGAAAGGAAEGQLPAKAQAAVDSANALFRKKQYAASLAQYRVAGAIVPQHAAPVYGIYMVAQATKDTKLADSALAEIRKRGGSALPSVHDFGDSASLKAAAKKPVKGTHD